VKLSFVQIQIIRPNLGVSRDYVTPFKCDLKDLDTRIKLEIEELINSEADD
jgi:hypothetical protein